MTHILLREWQLTLSIFQAGDQHRPPQPNHVRTVIRQYQAMRVALAVAVLLLLTTALFTAERHSDDVAL